MNFYQLTHLPSSSAKPRCRPATVNTVGELDITAACSVHVCHNVLILKCEMIQHVMLTVPIQKVNRHLSLQKTKSRFLWIKNRDKDSQKKMLSQIMNKNVDVNTRN